MDAMAFRQRFLILTLAAALALGFMGDAFARAGGGFSFGSRGARTFVMPNSTPIAPRGAAPFDRSATSNDAILGRPPQTGFFSGRGMLLGGLLGAGLFGLLSGHGFFGLGGGLSILVLLLQLGLLFLVFKWIMGFIRGKDLGSRAPDFTEGAARVLARRVRTPAARFRPLEAGRPGPDARRSSSLLKPIFRCSNSVSGRFRAPLGARI
jgi:hypothetical protein